MSATVNYRHYEYRCPKADRIPEHLRIPFEERKKVAVAASLLTWDYWQWMFMILDRATFGIEDPVFLVFGSSGRPGDKDESAAMILSYASFNWHSSKVFYADESQGKPNQIEEQRTDRVLADADYLVVLDGGCARIQRVLSRARELKVRTKVYEFQR